MRVPAKLQAYWYARLAAEGFLDIEYGRDTVALQSKNPRLRLKRLLYQPVDAQAINAFSFGYYELAWAVFYRWEASGRSRRDCLIAELLARQEGRTGTARGIAAEVRARGLSPWSRRMVDKTLAEIHREILERAGGRPRAHG